MKNQLIQTPTGDHLSPREIQIIELISRDMLNKQIACLLDLSVHTVETHIRNIKQKVLVHSKAAIITFAAKTNII